MILLVGLGNPEGMKMKLVVGLGNPEEKYFKTYHNVGWLFLDALCEQNDIKLTKTKCKSKIYEGQLYGKKVVIAKPLTYMNNSGEAVVELTNSFKPEKTLVIYDDIDIDKGTFRFRDSGSAGTDRLQETWRAGAPSAAGHQGGNPPQRGPRG